MLHLWKILSFLGSEEFYLLIMPALIWCGDAALGLRVGVLFLLSANLNGAAKLLFHAPRPAWMDAKIVALATENSFGFPSGHAQNAMAVWGLLAAKAKTRIMWGIALVLIALIGLSRFALLVHFPADVLGGWVIGAVLLFAFLKLEKPVAAWLKKQHFSSQIELCLLFSFALFGLSYVLIGPAAHSLPMTLNRAHNPFHTQANTQAMFLEILSLNSAAKSAGALLGLLVGACWIQKKGGYINAASNQQKIVRYVLGLVGVLIFWFGLGKVLSRGEDLLSLRAAYFRYALVGFWISAGAPLVFRRIERRTRI